MFPNYESSAHIRLLLTELERVERGKTRRLLICLPPRHSKSINASQIFPAWVLGKHPDWNIIVTSYSEDLATDFGRATRNFLASPLFASIFPACCLSGDSAGMQRFATTAGGNAFFAGRDQALTGRGAHLAIIDDPLKNAAEAASPTVRRSIQQWYQSVLYPRLTGDGRVILIQTRWHQDDLAGWLLREHSGEGWRVVSLAALAEPEDALRRAEGAPLWPQRYGLEELNRIRAQVGPAAWAALYQQRPVPEGGAIFKQEWWQRFSAPPQFTRIAQSWDCAFGKTRQGDYSACVTVGEATGGLYVLHVWRDRPDFPALKAKIIELAGFWKPSNILIEDTASGQSAIQELRTTSLPIIPQKVDSDKVSRAQACTGMVESGRVYLPLEGGWVSDFLEELSAFPSAPHDDQVDAFTMTLNFLRGGAAAFGLLDYFSSGEAARELAMIDNPVKPVPVTRLARQGQAPAETPNACAECGSQCVIAVGGGQLHCNQCGIQWWPNGKPPISVAGFMNGKPGIFTR